MSDVSLSVISGLILHLNCTKLTSNVSRPVRAVSDILLSHSELILYSHIHLPLFLQIPAEAPFHVSVEISPVAGPVSASQAQGAPGALAVQMGIQALSVRSRKPEGSAASEFVEQAPFDVPVKRMAGILSPAAGHEADPSDGAVVPICLDGLPPEGSGMIAAQVPHLELGLGFHKVPVVRNRDGPAIFHTGADVMAPPVRPVRIAPVSAYMGVVPVVPGHHIGVAAVVPEPGAVQGPGQAVVLPGSIGIAGRGDAPFRQHSVHRLGVGRLVIPQLEAVIPGIQAVRPAEFPVPHPGPQAGGPVLLL